MLPDNDFLPCPASPDAIAAWAAAARLPEHLARRRFLQAAALYAIAGDDELRDCLILFGSAAAMLFHRGTRTANDLDFCCPGIRRTDDSAKRAILLSVHRALNEHLRPMIPRGEPWRTWLRTELKFQLSSFEDVAAEAEPRVVPGFAPPRTFAVASLNWTIGSKIIGLVLPAGGRTRPRDLYDAAGLLGANAPDRVALVACIRRCRPPVPPVDTDVMPVLRKCLAEDYQQGHAAPPIAFDEAWAACEPLMREVL